MTALSIIPVGNAAELDNFVSLAWKIYAHAPHWVPPIKKEEKALLTQGAHPYWEHAKGQLFLAVRTVNGAAEVVGRIAAVIDDNYNSYVHARAAQLTAVEGQEAVHSESLFGAHECCGAWGFFECENDREAAHALFNAAAQWLKEHGATFMRGPLNPSTNYTCGMLVSGFELPASIMMPWNHAYYPELVESWHMRKEQDLFAYTFTKESMNIPDWLRTQLDEQLKDMQERHQFTWRTSSKATLAEDIATMLDIYKESWADNWGFTPMPMAEAQGHIHSLKSVLDPNFFVLFFCKGEPAGGMLALPDMTAILKKINGTVGLTAPWHLWRAQEDMKRHYRIMLFGIRTQYRLLGLPLLLLHFMFEQSKKNPILQSVEGSWSLEDNTAINDLLEDFSGTLTKRYRIYRRELHTL